MRPLRLLRYSPPPPYSNSKGAGVSVRLAERAPLDWANAVGGGKERTLHLSLSPDRPATGRPLVGVEWRGPYRGRGVGRRRLRRFVQLEHRPRLLGEGGVGERAGRGRRLRAHTHRTARQAAHTLEGIVDPDGLDPDGFTYRWIRVEMMAMRR